MSFAALRSCPLRRSRLLHCHLLWSGSVLRLPFSCAFSSPLEHGVGLRYLGLSFGEVRRITWRGLMY